MNILYPMFGMILLSCFVVVALYLSRLIPVIKNFGNLESARYSDEFRSQLPKSLRNITAKIDTKKGQQKNKAFAIAKDM